MATNEKKDRNFQNLWVFRIWVFSGPEQLLLLFFFFYLFMLLFLPIFCWPSVRYEIQQKRMNIRARRWRSIYELCKICIEFLMPISKINWFGECVSGSVSMVSKVLRQRPNAIRNQIHEKKNSFCAWAVYVLDETQLIACALCKISSLLCHSPADFLANTFEFPCDFYWKRKNGPIKSGDNQNVYFIAFHMVLYWITCRHGLVVIDWTERTVIRPAGSHTFHTERKHFYWLFGVYYYIFLLFCSHLAGSSSYAWYDPLSLSLPISLFWFFFLVAAAQSFIHFSSTFPSY